MEQFQLVKEALNERETLLHIAPHVAYEVPIMVPIYKWWQVPYMWAGLKMYDFIARLNHTTGQAGASAPHLRFPRNCVLTHAYCVPQL
jgi:glycerol-3-phosphate dehydrogenase